MFAPESISHIQNTIWNLIHFQYKGKITVEQGKGLTVQGNAQEAVITAETYKRPKPCPDPRLERFYGWKGKIGCTRHIDPGEAMFGPDLQLEVADFFEREA